jgi:WD40 repeat protein
VAPDGSVIVAGPDETVAVFDGASGKVKSLLRKPARLDPDADIWSTLSGDGKTLVVGSSDGVLSVFDVGTKKAFELIRAGAGEDLQGPLHFSADRTTVALGIAPSYMVQLTEKAAPRKLGTGVVIGFAADGTAVHWDFQSSIVGWEGGVEKWRIRGLAEKIDARLSPDGKVLAIADGRLHLVRISDRKTATLALRPGDNGLALVPDGATTAADVTAVLTGSPP